MSSYIPSRDLEASQWLNNFGQYVQTYFPELYITESIGNSIFSAADEFTVALGIEQVARIALKNAVDAKNQSRARAESLARTYGQKFRGDVRVADYRLIEMGLTPRETPRTDGVLNPASDLVATVDPQTATVSLKWNRNGSSKGTAFLIQEKVGNTGTWESVSVVTKVSAKIEGIPAGIPRFYRVIASRRSESAGASNVAVIYQSGTSLLAA